MGRIPGYDDTDLHPQIVEAAKALEVAAAFYHQRVQSIDGQYLKALEAAHDGTDAACLQVLEQVHAVRGLIIG